MRNYMKPELSMKKFVSGEAIADSLESFLNNNNISEDAGITAYMCNSNATSFSLDTSFGTGGVGTVKDIIGQ